MGAGVGSHHQAQPRAEQVPDSDTSLMQQMQPLIVSGEPFTERKSTFQVRACMWGACHV